MGNFVVEQQRDKQFRVTSDHDDSVVIRNIPTRELAHDIDRALKEVYQKGTRSYRPPPPWAYRDYDDE